MEIRDNRSRARNAIRVLYIYILLSFVAILSSYSEYRLYTKLIENEYITIENISAIDLFAVIIGFLIFGIFIVCVVLFLRWFRRAYYNVHLIATRDPSYEETHAVWSFFIPFLNLYRPLVIMKEIWEETQHALERLDLSFRPDRSTFYIWMWWLIWLFSNFVNNFVLRHMWSAETYKDWQDSALYYMLSSGLDIVAAVAVIMVIKKVAAVEQRLYNKIAFGEGDIWWEEE